MVRYSPIKSTTIDGICCLFMWKSNEIRFRCHFLTRNHWNADPCGPFWDQISCLMHWKYPFPKSYIYILKLGETKAHTTEKRMFWSRPSFSVFRTIRKKKKQQNQPQVSSFMAKLGRRTSNPSPFSHLDSSPAAPWWWLWGLWPQRPQSKSSVKVLPGLTTIWMIYR